MTASSKIKVNFQVDFSLTDSVTRRYMTKILKRLPQGLLF